MPGVEKVQGQVVNNNGTNNDVLVPVVKSPAVVQKQSALKKFWKGLFVEDLKTVRGNVTENIVKPGIKNLIANLVTGAVYMWLFGKNGNPGATGGFFRPLWMGNSNIVNYQNMYKVQNGVITPPQTVSINNNVPGQTVTQINTFRSTDVYDPSMFAYATWQDAENVFISLAQRIGNYGVATVRNLYDLSGATPMDNIIVNWGWYDLPTHSILPRGDGTWILKLPQPVYLNAK